MQPQKRKTYNFRKRIPEMENCEPRLVEPQDLLKLNNTTRSSVPILRLSNQMSLDRLIKIEYNLPLEDTSEKQACLDNKSMNPDGMDA
ncbi:hypothetical protein T07_567 [Trichinella nelsoni]|uniref:Uncharacterized protein n=1 Tax=Trichinella nelsoni TaxID=6336 RepID=A0A0V0RRQ2_9BILA|nr:hypothetical protein T07_567 [Trichinella nelsoni]